MKRLLLFTIVIFVIVVCWRFYKKEAAGPNGGEKDHTTATEQYEKILPEAEPVGEGEPAIADAGPEEVVAVEEAAESVAAPVVEKPVESKLAEVAAPSEGELLLAKADGLSEKGDMAGSRIAYMEALKAGYSGSRVKELKEKLTALNEKFLFSSDACAESLSYTVTSADRKGLGSIAAKYDTTYQLIMKLNGMKDSTIRVDQQLKIIPGPFDVVVHKSRFQLEVYLKDKFIKSYPIGLGKNGSTPTGEFNVTSKLVEPSWFRPGGEVPYGDPENPLGTRWIGFKGSYGIHGTWEPESIGGQESRGCVRMLNRDVEELFDLVVRTKSKVTVFP